MWCLWDLGAMCESLYGHATFAAVYVVSGIGASLASVWWRPGGVSAGASGAIFGIVGALIASHYLGEFSAPLVLVRSRLRSVLVFAAYALLFGAFSGRTDNAAHIGGLVTGVVFGALIARLAPEREPLRRAAVVLSMGLVVFSAGAWLHRSRSYLIHAQRGDVLIEQNKNDQAITELRTAIRERPDYFPAHFSLAHAYFNKNQFDLAEAELKRVLELKPGHPPTQYELGMVYLHQKRTQPAKEMFTELLRSDKDDAYAHLGMAMTLAREQNHAAAIPEYELAAQLEPELRTVFYQLGQSQAALKNYDAAIAAFQKQQQSAGDDVDTETALAEAYRAKGMKSEAENAMRKANQMSNK
jgi:tetratricopeptide (TPR) repeat protein